MGGGDNITPLPLLTREPAAVEEVVEAVVESSQQLFVNGISKIFYKRSQVRPRSGHVETVTFRAIDYRERLSTTASPSLVKMPEKKWRRYHIILGLILRKGQGQGRVK